MDPLWILTAFILGFIGFRLGLPPMVGYLIAGFVLQAFGVEGGESLEKIADLGVLLLLFSIGLKLHLRDLIRPEIWAGASIHMLITVVVFGLGIFTLSFSGLSLFSGLDFKIASLIAFALSFSSTVFAVKVLEERGEMASMHGRASIGILIMQDILAVLFMTFSVGKLPSPWAIVLVGGILAARPLLLAILDRAGHRELVLLFGIVLALGLGAGGFEAVGLKPDLGALLLGVLVAGHSKSDEMAKALLSFKDLFLVGFFLSIGLTDTPTLQALGVAAILTVVVVFKVALYFLLMTRFRLRARTAMLASLSLANYSEFGLLVAAIGYKSGWISKEWLIILALAVSLSFIIASPLNKVANIIYERWANRLRPFETRRRHPDDQPIDPVEAEIAVFGMGRVGTAAYEDMRARYGDIVIGVDFDADVVNAHQAAERHVIIGDPTDIDFWERAGAGGKSKIRLVLLAMPEHTANIAAVQQLNRIQFDGKIAATAKYEDEVEALRQAGAQAAYYFYAEAGYGFAEHVCQELGDQLKLRTDKE